MRAVASTLSRAPAAGQKQKAPPRDGAFSPIEAAGLFFLFPRVTHVVLAAHFGRLVVARQNADAAALERAGGDAGGAHGSRAELDAFTTEVGLGRCAGKQRGA